MHILSYIKVIRPLNGIMSAVAVYIATLISGAVAVASPFAWVVGFAMLVVFFVSGFGMIVNDIYDIEIDKVNKPARPLPSGKISVKSAKIYAVIFLIIGVAVSWFINTYAVAVALLAALLLFAYAAKLKKVLFVGNIIISLLVALTFVYGGLVNMNVAPVLVLGVIAFFANLGREVFKTCEDVLGDKKEGVDSIAIRYGVIRAKALGSLFVLVAIVLSAVPYIIGMFGLSYVITVIIADLLFVASAAAPVKYSSKLTKLAMLVALIAFLVGVVVKI